MTFTMICRALVKNACSTYDKSFSDLGGACTRTSLLVPYGTQFFRFRIHFWRKVPASEVHAPPLREILDLPL